MSVPQERLSSFFDQEIDFLKLDVEGAETGVLRDLIAADSLRHIRQLSIEYHHHIDAADDSFSKFLGALEQQGFGYQIKAQLLPGKPAGHFQDILVAAYRKDSSIR